MTKEAKDTAKNATESDEEDEEYVPGADEGDAASSDDENDVPMDSNEVGPTLSITKQKAVDDAFFDLFGYEYTYTPSAGKSIDKVPIKSATASSKQRKILSFIFGRNSSMKLIS